MEVYEENVRLRKAVKILQEALAIAKSEIAALRNERRELREYIRQMLVNNKKS